jgi:hypothetical protein
LSFRHFELSSHTMKKLLTAVCIVVTLLGATSCSVTRKGLSVTDSSKDPYLNYIARYSNLAVTQMKKHGIPASIILAQGLLESDAGRSTLAVRCNNHFGIKCHNDWRGRTMRHDDDARNECFRCYGSAEHSFRDHSLFLVNGARYGSLFLLDPGDYEGWAKGLKAAGYATNPYYAEKLIELIERYGLDRYDVRSSRRLPKGIVPHVQFEINGVKCVRLAEGESLKDIAREYQMSLSLLRRFNDVNRHFTPPAGTPVYLERKRHRTGRENATHTVRSGDSMWSISQQYGVRMKTLIARNNIGPSNPLATGMVLKLR